MIKTVAKRYAKALVELSHEKKLVDKTKADLTAFVGAVEASPTLQKLFSSPAITPEAKKTVIAELASRLALQPLTARFIAYLAEAGRIRHVREVSLAFNELLADQQNRAIARLTTAAPLNNGDMADIKKKLEAITAKQVEIDAQVDPSVIGGARAQIGSVIYDGTIKNQLSKIREQLAK